LRIVIDPSSLRLRTFPDPVLRRRGADVPVVDDEVRAVARRMIELMFEAEGIGLAAPQVGVSWRMFVAHVPEAEDRSVADVPATATAHPVVYINPVVSEFSRDLAPYDEGCLSLPEITGDVRRPSQATITAVGIDGQRFSVRGAGLLARCWQHELDHLDGVLIIDRMTPGSRLRNRAAVRRLEQDAEEARRA
jgi:peptide deformylase